MKKPTVNKTTTMKGAPSWDKAKAFANKVVNPPVPKKKGK